MSAKQQTLNGEIAKTDEYRPTHGYGKVLKLHSPDTDFETAARRINRAKAEGWIDKKGGEL